MEAIDDVFSINSTKIVKETNPLEIAYHFRQLVDENNFVLLTDKCFRIIYINNLFTKVLRLKNINLKLGDGLNEITDINSEYFINSVRKDLEFKGSWFGKLNICIDNTEIINDVSMYRVKRVGNEGFYYSIIINSGKIIDNLKDEYTSDDYLTRVIKNTEEVLFILDKDGTIINYTEDIYGVFNNKLSKYKNKPFYELGEEYCKNQIRLDLQKVIHSGEYVNNQCEFNIDGNYVWVKYFISSFGEGQRLMVVVNDLSSKDKYEFGIEKSIFSQNRWFDLEQQFVLLFDAIEEKVVKINAKLSQILLENDVRFRDINLNEIFNLDKYTKIGEVKEKLLKGESYKISKLELLKNTNIFISLTLFPIKDNKNISNILFVAKDITAELKLKELEEEKRKQEIELLKAKTNERLKGEFISNISHEFKTPLNVIYSGLQTMEVYEEKQNNWEFNNCASSMKLNCYRLIKLTENIVDSNKLENKCYNLTINNFDVVKEIESLVEEIIPYCNKKDIEIIFDTNYEEYYSCIDLINLRRVILNLVSNSMKNTNAGGRIVINLEINEEDDNLKIMVEDNGKGIPKEHLNYIFEQYKRVDKSFTRDSEGLGVGLYIAKEIIKLHGGFIEVDSTEGRGTVMTITLPILKNIEQSKVIDDNKVSVSVEVQLSDVYM